MDKKTYTIIGMSLLLAISLGFSLVPEPTHECVGRELSAYCFDLSSTGKTCYTLPGYTGGKRCTEGWKEIGQVNRKYICNPDGCIESE